MADPPRYPDPSYNVSAVPDRESTNSPPTINAQPATPRWVKVSWSITLAVVVLFAIGLLIKGPHRPGSPEGFRNTGARPPVSAPAGHTSAAGFDLSEVGFG